MVLNWACALPINAAVIFPVQRRVEIFEGTFFILVVLEFSKGFRNNTAKVYEFANRICLCITHSSEFLVAKLFNSSKSTIAVDRGLELHFFNLSL